MTVLSRDEFEESLQRFVDQVHQCPAESPWLLCFDTLNHGYLHRRASIPLPDTNGNVLEDATSMHAVDPACASVTPMARLEHYVVYSSSYQVPVLYFEAFNADDAPLTLEEVYTTVVPMSRWKDIQNSSLSLQGAITQAEHPHRGVPCWHIHPCQTQTLLKSIQCKLTVDNYIKTWLSFIGWVAGCRLSKELFMSL